MSLINRFDINLVISLARCESKWDDDDYGLFAEQPGEEPSVWLWDPQYTVRGDEITTVEPIKVLRGSIAAVKPLPLTKEELDYLESFQTLRHLKA